MYIAFTSMLMPPLQSIFPMNKETNMRLFPDCPALEESKHFCFSCDFLLFYFRAKMGFSILRTNGKRFWGKYKAEVFTKHSA